MSEELVSVIIPVYNAKKYLEECLESLVNQTYENLEIILIDDGSTDESAKICDNYADNDNRIKVIHQRNHGSGYARNQGLNCASGDYVTFVDSDDYIYINTIEMMVAAYENQNTDISIDGLAFVDECSRLNKEKYGTNTTTTMDREKLLKGMLLSKYPVSVVNKMYRKKLIDDYHIKFIEEYRFWEDLDFNIKYLSLTSKRIMVLEDSFYFARKREGSQSRTMEYVRNGELLDSTKYIWDSIQNSAEWSDDVKKACATLYANTIISVFYAGGINIAQNSQIVKTVETLPANLTLKKKSLFFLMKYFPNVAISLTKHRNKIDNY